MKKTHKIKDLFRIFRAQTASAVFIYVMIPYLAAGGNLFSWFTLVLAIWSILTHHISFGHNTVLDTLMGWDQIDPNKSHHPLIEKRIHPHTGLKIISVGILILSIIAIILVYYSLGNNFYAMIAFSFVIVGGMIYDEGISKISVFDFIPIGICFSSLTVFSYFLISKEITLFIILLALYVFFLQWFEIGIEGEIKEIEIKEEKNMLQKLGVKCDGDTFSMGKAIIYPWIIKIIGLGIAGYILYKYTYNYFTLSIYLIIVIFALYFCYELTKKRKWNREKTVRDMAIEEIFSIFIIPLILMPIIGIIEIIIVILVSLLYFVGMNKILWGTYLRPKV